MISEVVIKYPVVFFAGMAVALLVTALWRRVAPALGLMDKPGGRKIHREPIPVGGGIALFVAFHAVCAVVFLFPWKPFAGQIAVGWWLRFLPLTLGVVALGLWDDRFQVKPAVKLAGQFLLATAAYFAHIRLQNVLGHVMPAWVDYAATVLWFLTLMNSFNLIDGIDGLATGIALIAAIGIGISLIFRKAPGDVLLFLGFAGACLGFLRYNFYPASVFLGETGSLFIGFTLAALAISTSSKGPAVAAIGMPLLAVGVPLFDTLLAVWRRSIRHILARAGEGSPLMGIDLADADHLHHRLLGGGAKHDRVAWVLYAATAALAAVGVLASVFHDKVLGILGLTFLIGAYTVVRHLAWIELQDSGQAVLRGLSRPVRRNRTLILYIVADIVILNLAMLGCRMLLDLQHGPLGIELKKVWLKAAPIDVVPPFLMLLLFRSYSRVWYLARISEYVASGFAVILGCAFSLAIRALLRGASVDIWHWVMYYLLLSGLAAPFIVGIRAAVRVVQDLVQWRTRGQMRSGVRTERALVCGAGYRTTLFLRQITFRHDGSAPVDVVGLVASDDAIRGHFIHGIRVLGNLHDVPVLVLEHAIRTIYVVEDIDPVREQALCAAVGDLPVRVVRWNVVETELKPA